MRIYDLSYEKYLLLWGDEQAFLICKSLLYKNGLHQYTKKIVIFIHTCWNNCIAFSKKKKYFNLYLTPYTKRNSKYIRSLSLKEKKILWDKMKNCLITWHKGLSNHLFQILNTYLLYARPPGAYILEMQKNKYAV